MGILKLSIIIFVLVLIMTDWVKRILTVLICAPLALKCLSYRYGAWILLQGLQLVSLFEYEVNICQSILPKKKGISFFRQKKGMTVPVLVVLGFFSGCSALFGIEFFHGTMFLAFICLVLIHFCTIQGSVA